MLAANRDLNLLLDHLAHADLDFLLNLVRHHHSALDFLLFHDRFAAGHGTSAGLLLWDADGVADIASLRLATVRADFLSAGLGLWLADSHFVLEGLIFTDDLVNRDFDFARLHFRHPDFLIASHRLRAASRTTASIAAAHEGLHLDRAIFPVTGVFADGALLDGRNAPGHLANTLMLLDVRDHHGVLGRDFLPLWHQNLIGLLASLRFSFPFAVFVADFLRLLDQPTNSDLLRLHFRAAFDDANLASLGRHVGHEHRPLDHARGRSRTSRLTGWPTTVVGGRGIGRQDHQSEGREAGPKKSLHVAFLF